MILAAIRSNSLGKSASLSPKSEGNGDNTDLEVDGDSDTQAHSPS